MRKNIAIMMLAATAAAAADDPGGWSKARWGNTDAELIQAFGGEAVVFEHPDKNIHARVGIESMDLAGMKFRVYMVPGPDDRLQRVLIMPRQIADATDEVFQTLEELLVQKYGQPWKSSESDTTSFQWTFDTTVITLARIQIPAIQFQMVHLEYAQKSAASTDKL